jgi:hypothetical protein
MIQTRADLLADLEALEAKYSGNGNAVAVELVRRGATCITGRNTGKRNTTVYECVYFFCKGYSLQHLSWLFAENDAALLRESEFYRRAYGTRAEYIDYTFVGSKACYDKGTLRQRQREFALGGGGVEFKPKTAN